MTAPANGNGNGARWTTVSVVGIAVIIINAFWGMAWNSITSAHDKLERRVEWALMPKDELLERFRKIEKEQDREREERQTILASTVSRVELTEKWHAYEAAHAALDKKVDGINEKVSSIYSTTDVIREIQDRLKSVESWLKDKVRPEDKKP